MDIEKISKYLLTTVLKLLKGVPDLWRADVSRIIKELKEMVKDSDLLSEPTVSFLSTKPWNALPTRLTRGRD